MIPLAHVAGLPVEETILGFAPAGVALVAALRLARERTRRWTRRILRVSADRLSCGAPEPIDETPSVRVSPS